MPQAAQPISDREILADILLSQKQMTDLYNLSAGKCSAGTLQSDMLDILREEHNIRAKVYEEMEKRIGNVVDRGVALKPGFTLRDLYNERVPLYEHYADIVVDEEGCFQPGETVDKLRALMESRLAAEKAELDQMLRLLKDGKQE